MQTPQQLAATVLDSIPFAKFLDLKIKQLDNQHATIHLAKRPEFIGNHIQGILHGGVIASVLDSAGGLIVMYNLLQRTQDLSFDERVAKLGKVGTIDMRVDYLRPGRGETFTADAHLLRSGNKVSVTRMHMHNDQDELIAVGTGTYLIG